MVKATPGRPICVDKGVIATGTGVALVRVDSRPASGQYTFDDDTAQHVFSHANDRRPVTIKAAVWNGYIYTRGTLTEIIQA